ncbi:FkbM family methyltransferase [Cupriavidus sp. AcVe19-1a]|uniref:FkbM family methyltransferase n=1 Tax=Cupriavidus sp. AcVe19-1a TaxID=2821359 RepID=UPI001AE38178|nr:FkbM family methyltransferase [Cupriavidus sp. AcVe19-1a]MBP0628107.1 FkbM family methyltransferase [Cupriavidus sp. AcVe19-1a]
MNKIHRDGVDVSAAFQLASKRMRNRLAVQGASVQGDTTVTNDPNTGQDIPQEVVGRSWIKKVLRPVAKFGFRLAKPLLRPIASRMRSYLLDGLHQNVVHEIRNASAIAAQEGHATRELLRSYAQSQQEIRRALASTVQELRALRELQPHNRSRQLSNLASQGLQEWIDNIHSRLDRIEEYGYATARRVAIPCSQGDVLVKTEVGFILCAASDHALLACLIDTGDLELGTRLLIQKFLRPGDVFVDVGANIGMHTLAAAKALHGQGQIIAFEPFEPTKKLLERSAWLNGYANLVQVHHAAVSRASGKMNLYLGATSGHHSLFHLDSVSGRQMSGPVEVEVPVVSLDEVVPASQRVDLLKIDVEGAELDVIEGGRELLASNKSIGLIVEFGPSHLRRTNHSTVDWFNVFARLGFHYRVINPDSGVLEDWPLEQLERVDSANLFFARDNSVAWRKVAA